MGVVHSTGITMLQSCSPAELVTEEPFFAPAPAGLFDNLMAQYQALRARIETVASFMEGEGQDTVPYFLEGNIEQRERLMGHRVGTQLFRRDGAIASLNADFWGRALKLTDVYDCMPQARREEWNQSIRELKTPEFTEDTVRSTIESLLDSRQQFFAERVDGIFRALSGDHVTNRPEGFASRMILNYVFSDWGGVQSGAAGVINDLRVVIAKFMGRDEPRWFASDSMLKACRKVPGQWHAVDGGALRVRVYKKGTAHIEVHPDMAWRLNAVLAHLHPQAIPASFRVRPARRNKAFQTIDRPLPFAVVEDIARLRGKDHIRTFDYGDIDKHVRAETTRVLEALGAIVRPTDWNQQIQFDYNPREVLAEIVRSGCIPDKVSHQYYPTPEPLARRAVALADVQLGHQVLEPSAGQGAIAQFLPRDQLTCIELSALHVTVLRSKGFAVEQADFLEWARQAPRFDRIVMNPPFSQARAQAHLEAAAGLLAPGGQLVAILPASMRGRVVLSGMELGWSEVIDGAFADASVSVALLQARRPAA